MSMEGGDWRKSEIGFLRNPTVLKVKNAVNTFLKNSDYTFVVFSGHGFINTDENNRQYVELLNGDISIRSLITNAPRQTIIIDACRGYYSPQKESLLEKYSALTGDVEHFEKFSTRALFDKCVLQAEKGLTVLYAASRNESALDTPSGGAYLFSLLSYAQAWAQTNSRYSFLPLRTAHVRAKKLMLATFDTIQKPSMNSEKRINYFPIAVKIPVKRPKYLELR